ncbi:hypothetical protein Mal15_05040 [Stieleria maiorica]|uniref:Uncharacterized protein n=1 Tax=Stieleria maiorica TaxID=2795974 RepID=A0A5B9M8H5_9BACT|nr:hypothetical protein [Stieleria maiorica]QEF96476.1 hypothetical protein Mal15_05040 [Stieleria maiorica]
MRTFSRRSHRRKSSFRYWLTICRVVGSVRILSDGTGRQSDNPVTDWPRWTPSRHRNLASPGGRAAMM